MIKYIIGVFSIVIIFAGSDCRKNPVVPYQPLDTTSHAFTFQQLSWGGGGGSFLSDVVILNDTSIWCAGEIQLVEYDSLGRRDYRPYSLAHWDGANWNLLRLFDS